MFQYAFLVLSLYTYNIFCNIQEELDKLNKASENINRIELLLEVCYILCMKTRSSATTEKQRISCACLPRLPNWSCNAQNTAESQRLYYFWHSNALIQELLADNAFCHEIAAEGHSLCKPRGTPMNIPINLIFPETRNYIFVEDSMGLSSFKFVQWALKDASFLHQSAFWLFKVIQGRWFWYQSKAHMRLPISD